MSGIKYFVPGFGIAILLLAILVLSGFAALIAFRAIVISAYGLREGMSAVDTAVGLIGSPIAILAGSAIGGLIAARIIIKWTENVSIAKR